MTKKINIKELSTAVTQADGFMLDMKWCSDIKLSKDGRILALNLTNKAISIWDLVAKKQITYYTDEKRLKQFESIHSHALSADGKKLVICYKKNSMKKLKLHYTIVDIATEEVIQVIDHIRPLKSLLDSHIDNLVAFDHTGNWLLTTGYPCETLASKLPEKAQDGLGVWDLSTGKMVSYTSYPCTQAAMQISEAISRNAVLACYEVDDQDNPTLMIYWTPETTITFCSDLANATASISPDGETIVVNGTDKNNQNVFQLFNSSGTLLKQKTIGEYTNSICSTHWHPDGQKFIWSYFTDDALLIKANSLDILEKIRWYDIKAKFAAPNYLVLVGDYNLVIPADNLAAIKAFEPEDELAEFKKLNLKELFNGMFKHLIK